MKRGASAEEREQSVRAQQAEAVAPVPERAGFVAEHERADQLREAAGEQKHVKLTLSPRDLSFVNELGDRLVGAGDYVITVGGGQPGTGAAHAEGHLTIQGNQGLPE